MLLSLFKKEVIGENVLQLEVRPSSASVKTEQEGLCDSSSLLAYHSSFSGSRSDLQDMKIDRSFYNASLEANFYMKDLARLRRFTFAD